MFVSVMTSGLSCSWAERSAKMAADPFLTGSKMRGSLFLAGLQLQLSAFHAIHHSAYYIPPLVLFIVTVLPSDIRRKPRLLFLPLIILFLPFLPQISDLRHIIEFCWF
jgi:hypothetical protein